MNEAALQIEPVVKRTRHGEVIGQRVDTICVFKGIPYAAPPVDNLRFRAPQPPQPWTEAHDATRFGAAPIQSETPALGPVGPISEDCLTLNVWTPATPGPHPVLVWIYGGANIMGTANDPAYDGADFARADLVVVSMNYRVGALGFLELGSVLPDYAGSSLNGLRDIACALQWVRDNIAAFGGDPGQVSVIGESAGAKNLCALMTVPAVHGLFHRAAVLSGGGDTAYASLDESAPVIGAYLSAAGLDTKDAGALLAMPVGELLAAQEKHFANYPQGFSFRPTVDGDFLPARPIDGARRGAGANIDLVIGTCRDESAIFLFMMGGDEHSLRPQNLSTLDYDRLPTMEARYAEAFPEWGTPEISARLLTAESYWLPSIEFAEAHAASQGKTRMYRFDSVATAGPLKGKASHGADLAYLWTNPLPPGLAMAFGPPDADLVERIQTMWINWARTGALSIEGAPAWPAYDAASRQTMLINALCEMVADPDAAERELWMD